MAAKGLERYEQRIVDYVHQRFSRDGKYPDDKAIQHYAAVSPGQLADFWISQVCLDALQERGVIKLEPDQALTAAQLFAIEKVTNHHDKRTLDRKLKDLEIPSVRWNTWMLNDNFARECNARSARMLANSQAMTNTALLSQVEKGNMAAIEYVNKQTGRYNPQSNQQIDMALILTRVFDIIQKHVHDQATLASIGNDLMVIETPVAKALER